MEFLLSYTALGESVWYKECLILIGFFKACFVGIMIKKFLYKGVGEAVLKVLEDGVCYAGPKKAILEE
ncbi:MAG: hypothetical protein K6E42_03490 [Synergistes sp.]|nr:hypothetical protein [Synergistes sp.]